jgi:hypothetical protein
MASINQINNSVHLVYFDTCVYRKTLYAELIKLAELANVPCKDQFDKVADYQKRWNVEGKTYEEYQDFLIEIYKEIYKKFPQELEKSASTFSNYINLHRYKYFEELRSKSNRVYLISDLPENIVNNLFGKDEKVKLINQGEAEIIVKESIFVASSKRFINFFLNSLKSVFFNPTIELLTAKGSIENSKIKIVVERKDIVYDNISFERFF